jgi:hypothetical protein
MANDHLSDADDDCDCENDECDDADDLDVPWWLMMLCQVAMVVVAAVVVVVEAEMAQYSVSEVHRQYEHLSVAVDFVAESCADTIVAAESYSEMADVGVASFVGFEFGKSAVEA